MGHFSTKRIERCLLQCSLYVYPLLNSIFCIVFEYIISDSFVFVLFFNLCIPNPIALFSGHLTLSDHLVYIMLSVLSLSEKSKL